MPIGHTTQKAWKSVSNDSFYEKQSMPPQWKYPISLKTEKRPIKNIFKKFKFKNAFLKENFKKWPHWPYIHIAPTDDTSLFSYQKINCNNR